MTTASLFIVIVDFNGWRQTSVCLQRLESSTYQDFQVVVVDHGTDDETADGMKLFPSYLHLRGDSEHWWTGATNLGVRLALDRGASHIMLLNNDCYVEESTLTEVMSGFDGNAEKIIAPVQRELHSGDVLVARASTCFTLGFPTIVLPHMKSLSAEDANLLPTRLIIGGRGVVIPAKVFERVGMFDEEDLPHYGADHDFYLRCRAQGIQLCIAPLASVSIDDTQSTMARRLGEMSWQDFKSSLHGRRSHRNIHALRTLFKRYYPVKRLYSLGVYLNLGRYFVAYVIQRFISVIRRG